MPTYCISSFRKDWLGEHLSKQDRLIQWASVSVERAVTFFRFSVNPGNSPSWNAKEGDGEWRRSHRSLEHLTPVLTDWIFSFI